MAATITTVSVVTTMTRMQPKLGLKGRRGDGGRLIEE